MLTIKNIDKIINITSPLPYKWYISEAIETTDVYKDVYAFAVSVNGTVQNVFYLNRESQYMSGRNEPVYRLYKNFDQSKINRWFSLHQISPYFIKQAIDKMLNE
jgi:hypothetical protein